MWNSLFTGGFTRCWILYRTSTWPCSKATRAAAIKISQRPWALSFTSRMHEPGRNLSLDQLWGAPKSLQSYHDKCWKIWCTNHNSINSCSNKISLSRNVRNKNAHRTESNAMNFVNSSLSTRNNSRTEIYALNELLAPVIMTMNNVSDCS